MSNTVSMFDKARNVNINNSSVMVNVDSSKQVIDRLFDMAAPNAILNADGRADEVRCYPGTREEVIAKIEKWRDNEDLRRGRMMWLSGPAGAGKSAICQTVAERCRKHGRHSANFFFFRGDATRNRAQPLIATLVYQLLEIYPSLRGYLTDCLTAKPLIYKASIEEQFEYLMFSPIRTVQQSSSIRQTITLIIDGLDECDDRRKQEQILVSLRTLADTDHSPFLVLVASRAEPHLVMSFNRIGSSAESIFLDDKYRPQSDIYRFIVGKFDEIKSAHSLARTLSTDWPSEVDIQAITIKSSGQFIYASTVMHYIECSPDSPALSLRTIIGMQRVTGHSPYAQLDTLYSYIFSKARDIESLKRFLAAHFICAKIQSTRESFSDCMRLLGYEAINMVSLFADIVAIVQVTTGQHVRLNFYHASLSDFLFDVSRSGPYHVNIPEFAAELSIIGLTNFDDLDTLNTTIHILQQVEGATETLSKSLLHASTQVLLHRNLQNKLLWDRLIRKIRDLYFQTDKTMFKSILQHWVRFGYRNGMTNFSDVDGSDLSPSALKDYRWYLTTEKTKYSLGLTK